ncbi:hypothetical protein LCGC14_0366970 [marine sediment metagenome]|uniref:Uncharacterized protein n=1 Tax=marine sediment metagenome TaxID=412755 RepID=A0A0F9VTB5_9ZZZZ
MPLRATSDSVGAQLAMMRKRNTKECVNPECKNVFEGLVITNYCSDECRFRASYLRRKERAVAKAAKAARQARRKAIAGK